MVLLALLLEIVDLALLLLRDGLAGGADGLGLNCLELLDVAGQGRLGRDEVGDERVHLVECAAGGAERGSASLRAARTTCRETCRCHCEARRARSAEGGREPTRRRAQRTSSALACTSLSGSRWSFMLLRSGSPRSGRGQSGRSNARERRERERESRRAGHRQADSQRAQRKKRYK